MVALYKYGTAAGVALALIIGAFFYGQHVANTANALAQAKAVAKAQAQADKLSSELVAQQQASTATVAALQSRIANQPAQERIVYVRQKVPGQTVYVTVPESGPVFVTNDAVSLYNASLPNLLPSAPSISTASTTILPSTITVSNYERTTLSNNAVCFKNTNQLNSLIKWVKGIRQ